VVPFDRTHRSLLHAIKFRKKRWMLDLYKPFIKQKLAAGDFKEVDIIIPVPIDGIRRRVREFNQAEDFAGIIASTLAKPVSARSLKRRIGFRPQSTLKQKERLRNIRDQFFVRGAQKFKGKSVLLVDDILTTGATLNECAAALLKSGARDVRGFVLARAITH
jgi:ComF family protein